MSKNEEAKAAGVAAVGEWAGEDAGASARAALHSLEARVREAVRITPEALEEEFVRVPADLAYWSGQYSDALDAHLRAEGYEDRLEALLLIEKRQELLDAGAKVTESQVAAAVKTDARMQAAEEGRITAEVAVARLKGVVEAIRAKRDMLIQIGATQRAEMERDPMILEKRSGARLLHGNG